MSVCVFTPWNKVDMSKSGSLYFLILQWDDYISSVCTLFWNSPVPDKLRVFKEEKSILIFLIPVIWDLVKNHLKYLNIKYDKICFI